LSTGFELSSTGGVLVARSDNGKYRVSIVVDRCKECGLCIHVCPRGVLVQSPNYNKYGYRYPLPEKIENCIGCKLCEYNCPDFAIYVEVVG